MNELAVKPTTGFGLMNREDLAKSLNNAAVSMPSVGGDKQYIKMLTKGRDAGTWVFGQSDTTVEDDTLWAINPMSIKHGYVAWDTEKGGAPLQEFMVPINRALPSKESLPALPMSTPDAKGNSHQLEYQDQRSFDAVCITDGEDEGVVVEYKQSSFGAMKLFSKIINSLLDQIQKGDEIVAVGKWNFSTYDHPKWKLTYNPEFEIIEWRTPEDTSAPETKAEPAKEEAPARTRQRAAAAAPADKGSHLSGDPVDDQPDEPDDLTRAYKAEETAQAEAAPRRRQRR